MEGLYLTPDLPIETEVSERLDRMWHEHIIACLAIINAQGSNQQGSNTQLPNSLEAGYQVPQSE